MKILKKYSQMFLLRRASQITLFKNNKKVLFVEAKKLSVDVEQREVIRQLAKYCFGEGMKYGF